MIKLAWVAVAALSAAGALAAPAAKERKMAPVRIALVSDTHIGTGEKGERYARHLEQAVADVNAAGVDLILITGDLTEGCHAEEVAHFRALTSGLNAPVFVVPGNHDEGNKRTPGKNDGVSAGNVNRYEAAFGPSFYSTLVKGIRLVAVNAGLLGSGLDREEDQWAFLERELGSKSDTPTILFLHNPPFVNTPEEGSEYFNLDPEPRARLMELIRKGGVRAVLSGHTHRPLRKTHEGVLYLTTPPVAFGLPAGKQPEGWTLVTLSPDGTVKDEFRAIPGG